MGGGESAPGRLPITRRKYVAEKTSIGPTKSGPFLGVGNNAPGGGSQLPVYPSKHQGTRWRETCIHTLWLEQEREKTRGTALVTQPEGGYRSGRSIHFADLLDGHHKPIIEAQYTRRWDLRSAGLRAEKGATADASHDRVAALTPGQRGPTSVRCPRGQSGSTSQ